MKVTKCLYCSNPDLKHVTHRSDNNNIVRCTRCKVMMVEEISDHTEDLYTAEYFEKDSDTKSGYVNYLSSPSVNLMGKFGLCRQFISDAGSHLDLGSADGSLMEIFSASGYSSVGLEISQDAVDITNSKGLKAIQSNLHTFPANLGKFDVITAFDLLEHADAPGLVLDHVVEHLNDDGYFVFSTLSVTKTDTTDYWFNHSLEHYIYYDELSLGNILEEKFGAGNFAFVAIEINGVSEFWGFGKKGKPTKEKTIITNIASESFDRHDATRGFYLALFYNQLSKFDASLKIINHFKNKWDDQTLLLAKFYNAFYQGKYEEALRLVAESSVYVSSTNALYWQALAFVREEYFKLREDDIVHEYDKTVAILNGKLFAYRTILETFRQNTAVNQSGIPKRAYRKARRIVGAQIAKRRKSQENQTLDGVVSAPSEQAKKRILITMPWMTFGGAETLIYNYCREVSNEYDISFITGLESTNEWEYKFREISSNIYHLPEMLDEKELYVNFVSGYIARAQIDVLHIVHNGFTFEMLPELKAKHPNLKVILTLFNDRVPEYVEGAIKFQPYIDKYVSDNESVAKSIQSKIPTEIDFTVIPNGINAYDEFNPKLFNRDTQRETLGIDKNELAVFFVGRLSPEKNPDVFIEAAKKCLNSKANARFFLIGDGPMNEDVKKLLGSYSSAKITWLGYQKDVAQYLSAADVFVLPSSIEGFPLSILEAMAMGVVVVASDVGAVSEIIDNGIDGYVVEPGSAKQIATQVQLLAKDTKKLNSMKRHVRNKVEQQYSNKILKNNYVQLYKDTIQ